MGFYLLDHFTGTDGDAWNSTNWPVVRHARSPFGPLPVINNNKGRFAMEAGDRRHVAFISPELADFDLKVKVRFVTPNPPNMYPDIGYRINAGVESGPPDLGYFMALFPHAQGVRAYRDYAGNLITQRADVFLHDDVERYFRIRCKGNRHQYKWWVATDPEPPTFGMDFIDDGAYGAPYTSGRIMLSCWNNDAAEACTVDWDDFRVEEILPAEAGLRVGPSSLSAINVGDQPVVAAYLGTESIPVP